MERRLYFLLGDLGSNALAGALVAAVSVTVFAGDWPVLVAMPLGMLVGMGLGMVVALAASFWFGAFEVMLPVATTGMLVGMLGPMQDMSVPRAALAGALVGVVVLAATYALNSWTRARGTTWTS